MTGPRNPSLSHSPKVGDFHAVNAGNPATKTIIVLRLMQRPQRALAPASAHWHFMADAQTLTEFTLPVRRLRHLTALNSGSAISPVYMQLETKSKLNTESTCCITFQHHGDLAPLALAHAACIIAGLRLQVGQCRSLSE
jgi:hypothetical protein